MGRVVVALLALQVVTGVALEMFFSASTTNAWASVAYIQDQTRWGWLVRGLHVHGSSALVIGCGLHLLQASVVAAYKRPRELVWWIGIVSLVLVVGAAITGFWLRWDQSAYAALQVELGIAGETPFVGHVLRSAVLGGNEAGNLTLTRAHALHGIVIPALLALVTCAHVAVARRLRRMNPSRPATDWWPAHAARDTLVITVVFAALVTFVLAEGGAALMAPADPAAAFDARPLWFMRWMFELRHLAGPADTLVSLIAPAALLGIVVGLPLLDRDPSSRSRLRFGVAAIAAVLVGLTISSYARDAADMDLATRAHADALKATRARSLARSNGVPITGPLDVFKTPPMWQARSTFEARCAGCHSATSKDRKGPIIEPGHGDRRWIAAFLRAPSADAMWGRTKRAALEGAMKPVEGSAADFADLVEMLYAESGATGIDAAGRDRGRTAFDASCTDCHSRVEGEPGSAGPGLGGFGSRAYYLSFISNATSAVHMGREDAEMPRFDTDLSTADIAGIADYLVWLRSATAEDLVKLGPL